MAKYFLQRSGEEGKIQGSVYIIHPHHPSPLPQARLRAQ